MTEPLGYHRYANIFPLIEGPDFFEFAEDIRENRLLEKIDLIHEAATGLQILDGRNRYRALAWLVSTAAVLGEGWGHLAGSALTVADLTDYDNVLLFSYFDQEIDGDPLKYVLSKNLKRRHHDESQRGMIAAELATLGHGGNRRSDQAANLPVETPAISQAAAAEMLNVSERTVRDSVAVKHDAAPEIADAVRQGNLAVSAAAAIAAQPQERQAEILANLPRTADGKLAPDVKKALGPVIAELRAEKVAAKREKRAEREEKLGRRLQSLREKSFGVAIEDFEWDHEPWSRETGVDRHPSMHYETASDAHTPEEIVARCAERFKCLADDCVLFKWVTSPHLSIGLKVLELQGFEYVTSLVWDKDRPGEARGPGYWFTGEHEFVLVGARGKVVAPAYAHFRSRFSAPVGKHSEKPPNIHEIIEFHWPTTPKVEFNARAARPGWATWGFDAPAAMADIIAAGGDLRDVPAIVEASIAGTPAAQPPLTEFDALYAISQVDRRDESIFVIKHYVEMGLAFYFNALKTDWSLTEAGWKRFYQLEAERKALVADAPDGDADRAAETMQDIAGRQSLESDDDAGLRREHHALGAFNVGDPVEGDIVHHLRAGKMITGKTAPKLTKAGKARLEMLDEHFDRLMKLNMLPTSVEELVALYGVGLTRLHDRVISADEEGALLALEHLELLQERANGNTDFGVACDDSAAERLRVETAAPIGDVPIWCQRGVFRLVIDGMPHLVTHDEDSHFSVHAEDPEKPFLSETGFRSFLGDLAYGCTVAEQAEAYIREHITTVEDTGGHQKPRKKPMSLPAVVYRLPTEAEGGREPVHVSGSIYTPEQQAHMATLEAEDDDDDYDEAVIRSASDYRVTPPGQPGVPDIVKPGDVVTTNYGSGPYRVLGVHFTQPRPAWAEPCPPSYSLAMTNAKKGNRANAWINDIVAVDGRLLHLFADNSDEVFIQRAAEAAPAPSDLPEAKPAEAPEIVDGIVQCRLPLSQDEMDMQMALTALAAGQAIDGEMARHLIGAGYAHATTTRIVVTDQGADWLRSLIDVPPHIDLPQFLENRETAA